MDDVLMALDLMDIKLVSGPFTSSNKRQGHGNIVVRLDIFLISGSLLEDSLLALSCILP
jgi:hypothetical protein